MIASHNSVNTLRFRIRALSAIHTWRVYGGDFHSCQEDGASDLLRAAFRSGRGMI